MKNQHAEVHQLFFHRKIYVKKFRRFRQKFAETTIIKRQNRANSYLLPGKKDEGL